MNRIVLALGVSAVLLAACGLRGDLDRPVPLFGNPADEGPLDPRNIKKVEDAARAEKDRKAAEDAAARKAQQQQMQQPAAPPAPATPAPQ